MTVDMAVAAPTAPAQRFDTLVEFEQLQRRVRSAEGKVANLERGLASNRRIGIAIGILMCQRQLTPDHAFAILKAHSQRDNVKVRDLAETVIFTGTL